MVGYPLNDDETAGPQAQQTARYAQRLAAVLPVPVMLWDKRLSTFEAEERLAVMGQRGPQSSGSGCCGGCGYFRELSEPCQTKIICGARPWAPDANSN